MQIKLKDLAKLTGYSITTVSRALAGYSDVNAQTREQVVKMAEELGYVPNQAARHLRTQSTQTFGVIIPAHEHSFSNDFFGQLIQAIGHTAALYQYDVLISAHHSGEEEMAAYRRLVAGYRVDGMILARTRQKDPRIAYLKERQFPFVVSGRAAPDEVTDFPYIDVDSQSGIRMLVEHFAALNHQHIGLILPPATLAYTGFRFAGYCEGLRDAGLPYRQSYVIHGDLMRTGGYSATHLLLDRNPEITAVIACNDLMALGAMSAIQARGLQVGDDIAVAGFDDIPAAEYVNPPLTTIHQPIHEIGQRLVRMLIDIIQGTLPTETELVLAPVLIQRASSGSPRR